MKDLSVWVWVGAVKPGVTGVTGVTGFQRDWLPV